MAVARGRKHGCPVNIRSWLVYVYDGAAEEWVRIYGLNSMTRTVSGETSDGSADTELWQEPYITKRSSEVTLEGEMVEEEGSGIRDHGQELLNEAALQGGCETDVTLRFVDPFGHALSADFVVTSCEETSDDTESGCSWTLEQSGEAEAEPYVQVTGMRLEAAGLEDGALRMTGGDGGKLVGIVFEPENASNRRFRLRASRPGVVKIADVTENGFTLIPLSAGESVIRVWSVNGSVSASVRVTIG